MILFTKKQFIKAEAFQDHQLALMTSHDESSVAIWYKWFFTEKRLICKNKSNKIDKRNICS